MNHKLYIGNAADVLASLPKDSAQLLATSPPYGDIKDYGHSAQIGFGETYDQYLERLNQVWVESLRVISPGCKVAINIGDQFKKSSKTEPFHVLPIHADIIQQCQKIGAVYLGGIIWPKITNTTTSGGGTWMGSIYYPRDGYVTYEHEFILLFRKPGKAPKPTPEQKELSKLTKDQRSAWFRGIWNLAPVKQTKHSAMFPVELPERLIRMFTFHGETVLDPFMGSGTTAQAAEQANRHSIGIDLQSDYIPLCQKRVPGIEVINEITQVRG